MDTICCPVRYLIPSKPSASSWGWCSHRRTLRLFLFKTASYQQRYRRHSQPPRWRVKSCPVTFALIDADEEAPEFYSNPDRDKTTILVVEEPQTSMPSNKLNSFRSISCPWRRNFPHRRYHSPTNFLYQRAPKPHRARRSQGNHHCNQPFRRRGIYRLSSSKNSP